MKIHFKSVRHLIEHICDENPKAGDDDRLLITLYWQHQGIELDEETVGKILKATSPETITRGRRDLEARGIIKVSPEVRQKRTARMNIMQNTMLTEKDQEVLSKEPVKWEEVKREDGTYAMREIL